MRSRRHVAILAVGLAVFAAQCGTSAVSAERQAAGAAAFATIYQVLQHPRCVNCHPSGRVPLQGDDSQPHGQQVHGGDDGKGRYALRCASCHFDHNGPGPHTPPGAPNWQLPAAAAPLVFQGRTAAELARQLRDPAQNGGKTPRELLHHLTEDPLVLWGWAPGDGRTPVPVPHPELVAAARTWVDAGCPVPR